MLSSSNEAAESVLAKSENSELLAMTSKTVRRWPATPLRKAAARSQVMVADACSPVIVLLIATIVFGDRKLNCVQNIISLPNEQNKGCCNC